MRENRATVRFSVRRGRDKGRERGNPRWSALRISLSGEAAFTTDQGRPQAGSQVAFSGGQLERCVGRSGAGVPQDTVSM
jgi:hypothetical protein